MKIPQWVYITVIAILAVLLLLARSCDNVVSTETKITTKAVEVKIPEVAGKFDNPTHSSEIPLSKTDTVFIGGQPIYLPSPLDEELKKELAKSKSEVERYKILADANRERQYLDSFEDDFVKIDVTSNIFGTIKDSKIDYKLKERKATVNETTIEKTIVKKDNFGLLAGAGVNKSLTTTDLTYEALAGVRIGKVNVLGSLTSEKTVGVKVIIEF